MKAYLKLRRNIELVGDLVLAEREINHLCSSLSAVERNSTNITNTAFELSKDILLRNARQDEIVGYFVTIKQGKLDDLVKKTSFIQEIWLPNDELIPQELANSHFYLKTSNNYHFLLPLLAAGEILTFYKGKFQDIESIQMLVQHLAELTPNPLMSKAVCRSMTSTLHVHGLHKYKAKFFPRMIRSLLLTEGAEYSNPLVLDPFVGSGTTLVEASFFNYESIGIDIDGLSCLISNAKLELLSASVDTISKEKNTLLNSKNLLHEDYHFPTWIDKKFKRWGNTSEMEEYESIIASIISKCNNLNSAKNIYRTAASDAISRKFNIRMMGTGVGRFALEIQKAPLDRIFAQNVDYITKTSEILSTLKEVYNLKLAQSKVIDGDATNLIMESGSIDLIITSPPYLPASSGRENYLIGKSISITALGILNEKQIKEKEITSLGAMTAAKETVNNGLPKQVYELYDFLINDELRKIKADPTHSYYLGLKKALKESYRVLKENGKAIYIIGKESVFYTFKTREVLFRVECDKIFEEIAKSVGFKIESKIDLELNKKNRNARPRGLDSYFESVFILRK